MIKRCVLSVAGLFATMSWGATGETLEVPAGGYTVAAGGETYAAVNFASGGTLSGGTLTLENGGEGISVASGTATVSCPVEMGTGGARIPLTPVLGATLKMTGVISGDGPILVRGGGATWFSGANTFSGDLLITNGQFHADNDLAFGSTEGHTSFIGSTATQGASASDQSHMQIHFHGITTAETFDRLDGCNYNSWNFYGTTHFQGPILDAKSTIRVNNAGASIYLDNYARISGELIGGTGSWYFEPGSEVQMSQLNMGGAKIYLNTAVDATRRDYQGGIGLKSNGGVVNFGVDDAVFNSLRTDVGGWQTIYMHGVSTFNFGTTKQHFRAISSAPGLANKLDGEAGSVCTVYSVPYDVVTEPYNENKIKYDSFAGAFTGALSLVVDGTYRDQPYYLPFVFSSGQNSSTGDLVLTNGAEVCFSNTTFWAGRRITVADTSKLRICSAAALRADAQLNLSSDATLEVPEGYSMRISVGELYVDGKNVGIGSYTPATAPFHLVGDVVLAVVSDVQSEDGEWTGGAADDNFATAGNWAANKVVEHISGMSTVTVKGGSAMLLDEGVALRRLSCASLPGGFTFGGLGNLWLGADGLELAQAAAVEEPVEMRVPVALASSQTWTIPANRSLVVASSLSSSGTIELSKTGYGELVLTNGNTFTGKFKVAQGDVHLYGGSSLGADSAEAVFTAEKDIYRTSAHFHGGEFRQTITLDGKLGGVGGVDQRMAYFEANSTNVFWGQIKNGGLRPHFENDARCVFRGGITGKQGWLLTKGGAGASMVLSDKPSDISLFSIQGQSDLRPFVAEINVATNDFGPTYLMVTFSSCLKLGVPFALSWAKNNTPLELCYGTAPVVDLQGNDQECQLGDWASAGPTGSRSYYHEQGIIRSDTAAVLNVKQEKADIFWRSLFEGGVSLRKTGPCTVVFSNTTARVCTTTGGVTVAEGPLVFAPAQQWPNVSLLGVEGGEMTVRAGAVLNPETRVSLSGSGVLRLDEGVVLRASELWVDGRRVPGGTYGSATSGANTRFAAHFAGKGTLRVRRMSLTISIR